MREVVINGDGGLEGIACPMIFNNPMPQPSNVLCVCDISCAWFNVERKSMSQSLGKDQTEYAYCKDHCIGKIKEPDNG